MFASMRADEIGMFVRLLWGEDVSEFPITARSINRRLRRVTRQARLPKRVTIRTWRCVGNQLSQAELGTLAPTGAGQPGSG